MSLMCHEEVKDDKPFSQKWPKCFKNRIIGIFKNPRISQNIFSNFLFYQKGNKE